VFVFLARCIFLYNWNIKIRLKWMCLKDLRRQPEQPEEGGCQCRLCLLDENGVSWMEHAVSCHHVTLVTKKYAKSNFRTVQRILCLTKYIFFKNAVFLKGRGIVKNIAIEVLRSFYFYFILFPCIQLASIQCSSYSNAHAHSEWRTYSLETCDLIDSRTFDVRSVGFPRK
jgi:hypothetical protein